MKPKFFLTGVLLLLLGISLMGQEKKPMFLYVESGIDFISCEQPDKDYIRADVEPYYELFATNYIRALMHNNFFGVRFGKRFAKNLLEISGGLRYTRVITSIGKPAYWSDSPDFFYVNYRTDGINTDYAKVYELNQRSDYIGIPVDIRIFPYEERLINVYYKAGASVNLNVGSKSDVVFFDDAMNPYEKDVADVIESPSSFFGSLNLGIGLKVGRPGKAGFNIETAFPIGIFTSGKAGFVNPQAGGGVQLMVRIPLNKKTGK
jgi:hypothetical protein